jgi:hypothetical protein
MLKQTKITGADSLIYDCEEPQLKTSFDKLLNVHYVGRIVKPHVVGADFRSPYKKTNGN